MSWEQRLPDGVSNLKKTETGFTASVDIPTDDDGFFGRECSTCKRFFKMRIDQWQALPERRRGHLPVLRRRVGGPERLPHGATAGARDVGAEVDG
jgi:hypothetical protein